MCKIDLGCYQDFWPYGKVSFQGDAPKSSKILVKEEWFKLFREAFLTPTFILKNVQLEETWKMVKWVQCMPHVWLRRLSTTCHIRGQSSRRVRWEKCPACVAGRLPRHRKDRACRREKPLGLLTSTSASFTFLYEDCFRVSQLSKYNFRAWLLSLFYIFMMEAWDMYRST